MIVLVHCTPNKVRSNISARLRIYSIYTIHSKDDFQIWSIPDIAAAMVVLPIGVKIIMNDFFTNRLGNIFTLAVVRVVRLK